VSNIDPEIEAALIAGQQLSLDARTNPGGHTTVRIDTEQARRLIEAGAEQARRERIISDLREDVDRLLPLLKAREDKGVIRDFFATAWGKGAAALAILLLLLNIARAARDLVSLGPAYDDTDTALVDDSMDGREEDAFVSPGG
jgi:hypothetical protein